MKVTRRGRKIDFMFDDGPEHVLTFDADRVHSAQHEAAEMHGWEQRLRDNAAIARKQKDGTVITVTEAMRRAAVKELIDHYHSGAEEWNIRASARAAPQNPMIAAIAAKLGVTYEEAQAKIAEQFLAELT